MNRSCRISRYENRYAYRGKLTDSTKAQPRKDSSL